MRRLSSVDGFDNRLTAIEREGYVSITTAHDVERPEVSILPIETPVETNVVEIDGSPLPLLGRAKEEVEGAFVSCVGFNTHHI